MWKSTKRILKSTPFNVFLIFLLASIVFFVVLKDDGDRVLSILGRISIFSILGLVGLMMIERLLLGYSLMLECKESHPDYSLLQGFVNAYVAGLFCNITPGASGGQIAQGYIFRKQGIPLSTSVGILWLDFIVYQTTMTLFVLLLLLLRFHYFYTVHSQFFFIVILGFLVSSIIIVFLWLLAKSPRFYHWFTKKGVYIAHRLHLIKDVEATLERIHNQLAAFDKEVNLLGKRRRMLAKMALCNFLRLVIYYSIPFFCAKALHIQVGLSQIIDIICLSSFVAMVNAFLPMPGSSGGTEATFLLMFSTIFKSVDAKSIMILWRLVTYYQVLIIGALVFFIAKVYYARKSNVSNRIEDDKLQNEGQL